MQVFETLRRMSEGSFDYENLTKSGLHLPTLIILQSFLNSVQSKFLLKWHKKKYKCPLEWVDW